MPEEKLRYETPKTVEEAGRRMLAYAMAEAGNGSSERQILFGMIIEASMWLAESLKQPAWGKKFPATSAVDLGIA